MDNNINDIGSANSEVVQSTRKTSHLTTANNCGGLSKVHPILLQQQHPPLLDSRLFLVDQCAHSTGSSAKEVKANHPSNMDASTTLSGSGIAVEEEKTNDNPDQKWLESSDDLFRDDDLCDICYEDDDNDSQDPDKILFACGEDMDLSDSGSKEEISLGGDGVGRDRSTTTPPFVSSSSTAILTMGEFGEQHISAYSAAGGALEKWKQPRTTNNSRSTSWHNEATDRPYRQCIILEM